MRILLIGSNGQLAQDLKVSLAGDEVIGLTHTNVDIRDLPALETQTRKHRPDCIINTAAFHRVDDCEDQVEPSFAVNATGVHNLVRVANEAQAVLVHFSTDYVFGGPERTPRNETHSPSPQCVYAMSKFAGELIVQCYAEKYFLVRTCGLYGYAGASGKGGNFVETMLRLANAKKPIQVVNDQVLTPTRTKDLADNLASLIRTQNYGLFHMTNTGECSWYEFAKEIFRQAGLNPELQPTTTETFRAKARRPAYSVLDNQALREAGLADFRPWQQALADYVRHRPGA